MAMLTTVVQRLAAPATGLHLTQISTKRILHSRLFTTAKSSLSLSFAAPTSIRHTPPHASTLAVCHSLPYRFVDRKSVHTYIWKQIKNKVASKRKGKHYKLKNHTGAVARWLIAGNNQFKRATAIRIRMNRSRRQCKRIKSRRRVLANATHRNLLKKLIPYYRKKYMK
ncbi:hypothetical protein QVD99_008228 [Batrachochytrium dendrobatidis]|uniref:50S ribosomal protein L35 n=1 Tax=Batrachochytrium dendrobatidis (strain JEL423) TaxID=403673 RepID=A0A177WUJ1_BATDL|nr:hypothetical protein O5D80_007095 [Batrachochytrium dendrobatidis]KAK5664661.1 hypothetical protein QVD99_008212 [Batrachochytrium dendrobatidis]KAK5664679.1 hypothetical protein QVD99_008228 [Batrachochytrium dendrobatidis]OAJ43767.1 hypothetical protein BDEG_27089 [Batrachochytrium dendrobatidis JEL423]